MSSWFLIDQAFALRLTTTLLHFLWQGTLIALLAALVSQLLRSRSAHARYAVNVSALLVMALCVLFTFAWVQIDVPVDNGVNEAATEAITLGNTIVPSDQFPSPEAVDELVGRELPAESATSGSIWGVEQAELNSPANLTDEDPLYPAVMETDAAVESGASAPLHSLLTQWAPWITIAYFSGVVILLLRLLHGTWGSLRLRRAASELTDGELLDRIRTRAVRLGMRSVPLLRWSAEVSVPVVIGIIRPLILLPASAATGLSIDQLDAVIAHELAHIRRYDLVINMLQRVIEALLFFHPAVWWVSRQVSNERELACDDFVLSAGFLRTQYADALVRMAEVSCNVRERRTPLPATSLAADGAAPTEFKRRILKVLGSESAPSLRLSRAAALAVVAVVLLALTTPLLWNRPLVQAGNDPEPENAAIGDDMDSPLADALTNRVIERISDQNLPFVEAKHLESLRQEFREYLSERVPSEIPDELRTTIFAGIDEFVRLQFKDADSYLGFRGSFNMLKWQVWTASTRKELPAEELGRREEQRGWMREYIRKLPAVNAPTPDWTHAGRIQELEESVFANVMTPFFYDPMSDEEFARFQKLVNDRVYNRRSIRSRNANEPEDTGTVIDSVPLSNALIYCPAWMFHAGVEARLENLQLRFPPGFPIGGRSMGGTTHFSFAGGRGASLGGYGIGRYQDHWMLYDVARKIPVTWNGSAEDFADAEKPGDLWYDTETGILHAARGAKLAVIKETQWYQVDRMPLADLKKLLEQEGRENWSLKQVKDLHPFYTGNTPPMIRAGRANLPPTITPQQRFDQAVQNLPTFVVQDAGGTIIVFRIAQFDLDSLFLSLRARPLPPYLPFHPGDVEHPEFVLAGAAPAAEAGGGHHAPGQHAEADGMSGHTTNGNSLKLTFSPDGRRLAVMNGNPTRRMFRDGRSVAEDWKPTVEIIDTDTEKVLRSLDLSDLPHDVNRPADQGPTFIEATAIAFSPDSRILAVGTSVGQLKLFGVETGTFVKSFDDEPGRLAVDNLPEFWKQMPRVMGTVKSIAFSADGKRLAVCGDSFSDWTRTLDRVERGGLSLTQPGRLKVFDVETGQLLFNPAAHSNMVADVAYSPDGKYLASAGRWMDNLDGGHFGDGVTLWDTGSGERVARIDLQLRGWMYDIEFSPDSQRILIGAQDFDEGGANGKGVAAMLSAETLAVLWKRSITRSAMAVAFNPQQRAAIVLTNREGLSYLDADDGKTQMVLKAVDPEPPKKQQCETFAISPQGHLLAYGVVEKGKGTIRYLRIGKRDPNEDSPVSLLKILNSDGTPVGDRHGLVTAFRSFRDGLEARALFPNKSGQVTS